MRHGIVPVTFFLQSPGFLPGTHLKSQPSLFCSVPCAVLSYSCLYLLVCCLINPVVRSPCLSVLVLGEVLITPNHRCGFGDWPESQLSLKSLVFWLTAGECFLFRFWEKEKTLCLLLAYAHMHLVLL